MGPQAVITHIANRGAHVDNALGDGGVTPHSLSARAFASFATALMTRKVVRHAAHSIAVEARKHR